jgi:Peptidase_C39 like family
VVPLVSFIVALSIGGAARPGTDVLPSQPDGPSAVSLDVPYVPQTESLCGGAAVAMVFRYWGDAHAGVDQFAALVDRRARGIETNTLVRAVNDRRWRAIQGRGSVDTLQSELRAGHPVIALIEARPQRYHYVVVVGIDADHVVIHDPTWGPSRPLPSTEMARRWAATDFWSLVIMPASDVSARGVRLPPDSEVRLKAGTTNGPQADFTSSECSMLPDAIDRLRREGLARADSIFEALRLQCPSSSAVLSELAGVRFAEDRWRDAAAIAQRALVLDPQNSYAWDLLGSSRFMQNDVAGALRSWNEIGKPRVDVVRIEGLARTRYALVTDALRLPTGSLLTAEQFERAERRLEELPDASSTRLGYRPQADGFAVVEGAIVETAPVPRGAAEWTVRGIRSAIDREIDVSIPGGSGEGELWSVGWRWWRNRPRVAASLAAPHSGFLAGVWRADVSWERETFQVAAGTAPSEEERIHGGITVADWVTARLRYELTGGIDSWNAAGFTSVGGKIERRALDDRLSIGGSATTWIPLAHASGFRAADVAARFESSATREGTAWLAAVGIDAVSAGAPLNLWQGAGEGHARAALARAHPLVTNGVITGPVFGRRLAYGTTELQQWIGSSTLRFAVAAFVDVARASHRAAAAAGDPFQIDGGIGIRIKPAGQKGCLRVDFGNGLRDRAHALTVGWQY